MKRIGNGILTALVAVLAAAPAAAQPGGELPSELEGIGIFDRSGAELPLDLRFVRAEGDSVRLGDLFVPGRPVILDLVYYNCPMLCNLLLDGQVAALRELEWSAGERFRVVTVSIDPRDDAGQARIKKDHILGDYGRPGAAAGWDFLAGGEAAIAELADSVGFRYFFDPETGEFNHAAGIFIITPEGRVSRTLYGIDFDPQTLRLSLVEASAGGIGTAMDQVLLFCFSYDPEKGSYAWAALNIMKAGGAVTVIAVLSLILFLLRKERRREGRA